MLSVHILSCPEQSGDEDKKMAKRESELGHEHHEISRKKERAADEKPLGELFLEENHGKDRRIEEQVLVHERGRCSESKLERLEEEEEGDRASNDADHKELRPLPPG